MIGKLLVGQTQKQHTPQTKQVTSKSAQKHVETKISCPCGRHSCGLVCRCRCRCRGGRGSRCPCRVRLRGRGREGCTVTRLITARGASYLSPSCERFAAGPLYCRVTPSRCRPARPKWARGCFPNTMPCSPPRRASCGAMRAPAVKSIGLISHKRGYAPCPCICGPVHVTLRSADGMSWCAW